ncbi:MAG: NADH-quinone oxidoreductase subunit I [bacterium]|nr:NADH-quinone oxidoreductase subunit I [bacterium]
MATHKPKESIARKISRIFLPLWGIRAGLYITARHLFRKKITVQYPEQKIPIDSTYRAKLSLLFEPGTGADICISCLQCKNICPVECITIIPKVDENKKRHVGTFDVDLSKCLFCGMCEEVCPEFCIVLDPIFDYSSYSRDGLYLTVSGLRREANNAEWESMISCKEVKKRESEAKKKAKEEGEQKQ